MAMPLTFPPVAVFRENSMRVNGSLALAQKRAPPRRKSRKQKAESRNGGKKAEPSHPGREPRGSRICCVLRVAARWPAEEIRSGEARELGTRGGRAANYQ
jgi:hypothetical protein